MDSFYALATVNRDAGKVAAARSYAEKLAAVAPENKEARKLLAELGARPIK